MLLLKLGKHGISLPVKKNNEMQVQKFAIQLQKDFETLQNHINGESAFELLVILTLSYLKILDQSKNLSKLYEQQLFSALKSKEKIDDLKDIQYTIRQLITNLQSSKF